MREKKDRKRKNDRPNQTIIMSQSHIDPIRRPRRIASNNTTKVGVWSLEDTTCATQT